MKKCLVPGCGNTRQNKENLPGVSFHRVPKNEPKRSAWLRALGLPDEYILSRWAIVCSNHFSQESFDKTSTCGLIRLREEAIPNVFIEENHCEMEVIEEPSVFQSQHTQPLCEAKSLMTSSTINLATSTDEELPVPAILNKTTSDMSTQTEEGFRMDLASRQELLSELFHLNRKYKLLQKKIRNLERRSQRKARKVTSLKNMISTIKKKSLINAEKVNILSNCSMATRELCHRQQKRTGKYSPELRKFAMSLHFYSPKAYSFIRTQFNKCLPHPNIISSWYRSIDGSPGFTNESFRAIKLKQVFCDYKIVGNLVFDEMAIRSKIELFNGKSYGFEDFGGNFTDDASELAKQALVFLFTGVNTNWKIPLGYFLCRTVNGDQKKELLITCLKMLHQSDVVVKSVTFDGASTNLTMAESLGCKVKSDKIEPFFIHPVTKELVFVFMDICHIIKMIRNAFADKKEFVDENGGIISWRYIELLYTLQEGQKFHIANKISKNHIYFKNQIMKVRLATQVLSNSVADALLICADDLKLEQFQGVHATVRFIKNFNTFFDIFNSKNMFLTGYKQALNSKNEESIFSFFEYFDIYIQKLVIKSSTQNVLESNRKTGFLGVRINIHSLKLLYLQFKEKSLLCYVPTYKFNQDHIELLFYSIRSSLGDNNNPTVRQFIAAYKKILVHAEIKQGSTGNCIPLENISVLHVSSNPKKSIEIINNSTTQINILNSSEISLPETEHDYESDLSGIVLNEITEKIVVYIAGYIVSSLKRKLKCVRCSESLVGQNTNNTYYSIIKMKQRGGLVFPSEDVIHVCKKSEEVLKHCLLLAGGSYLPKKYSLDYLTTKIMSNFINIKIFDNLSDHMFEQSGTENHVIHLIKSIIYKYLSIRINYLNRRETDKIQSLRKVYGKLILNRGQ